MLFGQLHNLPRLSMFVSTVRVYYKIISSKQRTSPEPRTFPIRPAARCTMKTHTFDAHLCGSMALTQTIIAGPHP
jgi:hypothetical protein